jgi:hypothetical protein
MLELLEVLKGGCKRRIIKESEKEEKKRYWTRKVVSWTLIWIAYAIFVL